MNSSEFIKNVYYMPQHITPFSYYLPGLSYLGYDSVCRWWHGLWQHCSVSCGGNGHRRRTVLCVRQLGPDEQIALEDWECESLENKPLEISECSHKEPCPVEDTVWKVGPWSEVSICPSIH